MRILFVASRYPWPVRRGDQLRAAQFLDPLVREHQVILLAPIAPACEPPSQLLEAGLELETYRRTFADRLRGSLAALLGGGPLQSAFFRSADLGRRIRRLAPGCDLGFVQLLRLESHLADFDATPVAVDLIDSLSLSFERRSVCDGLARRTLWRHEAERLQSAERRVLGRIGAACVVCERDRRHLENRLGPELTRRLQVVPLAMTAETEPGIHSERRGERIVLSGNLGYFPNRRAASRLLREVWPRLRERRPQARFVLAGDRPSRSLVRLARRARAEVLCAPSDLDAVLRGASVALAPLDSGAGFPVKVLEAWQAGVPVVASSWAAAGAGARGGEELLLADSDGEWVAQILSLLEDEALAGRLREAGLRRAREQHSQGALEASLARLLERTVEAQPKGWAGAPSPPGRGSG